MHSFVNFFKVKEVQTQDYVNDPNNWSSKNKLILVMDNVNSMMMVEIRYIN